MKYKGNKPENIVCVYIYIKSPNHFIHGIDGVEIYINLLNGNIADKRHTHAY